MNEQSFDKEKFIASMELLAEAYINAFHGALAALGNLLSIIAPLHPTLMQWERRRVTAQHWVQYRKERQ